MFAGTAATVAMGGASGAASTIAGNGMYNLTRPSCRKAKDLNDGVAFGTALGAMAPLMSGEAFVVGAGEGVVGETGASVFSGLTGAANDVGELFDPGAEHGFTPSDDGGECGCQ